MDYHWSCWCLGLGHFGIENHRWIITEAAGPWFNIKMSSYQYRKSHCWDKTVVRSSYLHNGISYAGKMSSLCWIGALMFGTWHFGIQLMDHWWIITEVADVWDLIFWNTIDGLLMDYHWSWRWFGLCIYIPVSMKLYLQYLNMWQMPSRHMTQ